MSQITLSLGSNIGDRLENLYRAIELLKSRGVEHINLSSFYETEPQGFRDQDYFVNCVITGETSLLPEELLKTTQSVERDMKRKTLFRWGPRIIDVDILTYDGIKMDSQELTIPHPRMFERAFVLVPLSELEPEYKKYLSAVKNQSVVKIPESN